jgi:hypothetical protein
MTPDDSAKKQRDSEKQRIERRVGAIDPAEIGKVAYTLDAYRSHIFYDVGWVDKKAEEGALGRAFAQDWKALETRLLKMARVTTKIPGTRRLAKAQSFFEAAWQILVPVAFLLMFAGIIAPGLTIIVQLAPYLIPLALGALIVGLLSRFFLGGMIARKIDAYFRENPEAQRLRAFELRETVQILIEEVRRYNEITGDDPKKNQIGLGLLDYEHIEVTKNPRPWRKYYIVKVTP